MLDLVIDLEFYAEDNLFLLIFTFVEAIYQIQIKKMNVCCFVELIVCNDYALLSWNVDKTADRDCLVTFEFVAFVRQIIDLYFH